MSIKSKHWYENQIAALENAARNTARYIDDPGLWASTKRLLEAQRNNSPIQKECAKIYEVLNKLKAEYYLYYG